MFVIYL